MSIRAKMKITIRSLLITIVLFSFSSTLYAQTLLRLGSNQFTVSVPSTSFSQTAAVSNSGTVAAVTGVPTTGSLTTPSFSFSIDAPVTPTGTATYSVGIIVDEQSSNRRLEVFIPTVTFAFEDASALNGTGSVGFSEPTISNPADPGYKYILNYADGSAQSLLPFVAESNFIDSINNLGFLATIDRSTGVVTLGNGLKVKPDIIVRPLSVAAQVFLNNKNGDENGVGFAGIGDVNGDGLDDYEIISAVGQQTLYGVAP